MALLLVVRSRIGHTSLQVHFPQGSALIKKILYVHEFALDYELSEGVRIDFLVLVADSAGNKGSDGVRRRRLCGYPLGQDLKRPGGQPRPLLQPPGRTRHPEELPLERQGW